MKKKVGALALSMVLGISMMAGAVEWQSFGAQEMGMGGVGVAMAQGPTGSYWNPAGLGQVDNTSGVSIPIGAQANIHGSLLQGVNDLHNVSQACQSGSGNCTQGNISNALNELASGSAGADLGAGLDLKFGRLAFFANNLSYAGLQTNIDQTHTSPNPLSSNYIGNNTSEVILNALSVTEVGMGYGHELPWVPGLNVGANVKALIGMVGYQNQSITQNGSSNLSLSKNAETNVEPGIDVGALWDLNRFASWLPFRPRVGITARNINNPSFKEPAIAVANGAASQLDLGSQVRAGVALSPFHFWNIAADADLTANHTIEGLPSRIVGVGTEINVFNRPWINIPLRAGISQNTALSGSGPQWSLGAGFNFFHIVIDVAATVSQNEVVTQNQGSTTKIPTDLGGMVQLSFLFGGAKKS